MRDGNNVALQSHTGSGKTLAFLLPLVTRAIAQDREDETHSQPLRLLVVVPSRELAMQIVRQTEDLVGFERRSIVQQAIGGANAMRQRESIRRNRPMIVVGTPGRVAELSREGVLKTHNTSILVLDEADDLLSDTKQDDLRRIAEHCGKRVEGGRQTVIVSATLTDDVLRRLASICPEPVRLLVTRTGEVAVGDAARAGEVSSLKEIDMPENVAHVFVRTTRRMRVDAIRRAIFAVDAQQALVSASWNSQTERLTGLCELNSCEDSARIAHKAELESCFTGGPSSRRPLRLERKRNALACFRASAFVSAVN